MSSGDPFGTGLVASPARAGGNVTGFPWIAAEVLGKTIDLLREILPRRIRVGTLINGNDPFGVPPLEQVRRAAGRGPLPARTATPHPSLPPIQPRSFNAIPNEPKRT